MNYKRLILCLMAVCLFVGGAFAQEDALGKIDTLTLTVENYAPSKWVVVAHIWNDEELAAFDIPIKYSAGMAKLIVDSVSFAGTRTAYFAQKYTQVDTTGQLMHFGGLAYMGPDKPPLAPGKGEVGRVYISVMGNKAPGVFAIDTAFYAPNNKLMLVDSKAQTIIPAVKIVDNTKKAEKKKK